MVNNKKKSEKTLFIQKKKKKRKVRYENNDSIAEYAWIIIIKKIHF